ncbi:unnamed protein product [Prorocentrum cordatum]|uniref:Uncharacterized protein n=1 Tax=Prorocentrum cordatum TaxID=2364126 RepID=A0ABN9TE56_9DINO|nr:unnamed protein product [Polarella glacialis]
MMGDDARSHWARLLWRRLAPEAAARLAWHLRCAGAELSECAVCRGRRVTLEQLEEHLVSLGHLANLAMSVSHAAAEEGVSWYDRAGGEHGDRVQHFVGLQGRAWFNHITGESDSTLNDGVVARPEWTCYDYAQAQFACTRTRARRQRRGAPLAEIAACGTTSTSAGERARSVAAA